MLTGNRDYPSRLSSREKYNSSKQAGGDSSSSSSFRLLYYGGAAGSVPFLWESRPGTPKHPSAHSPPPPLTPPPSYQSSSTPVPLQNKSKSSRNSRFFKSIFLKKMYAAVSPPPQPQQSLSWSLSSTSSFSSSYSAPSTPSNRNGAASPTSTLCFPPPRGYGRARVYYSAPIRGVKKAVRAIAGH